MFFIQFLWQKPARLVWVKGGSYAEIMLGDTRETFISYHSHWRRGDYERQWKHGLRRISAHAATSALVADMYRPEKGRCFLWWAMYKTGDRVIIQNQLMFFDRLKGPFDEHNVYPHIPPYSKVDEAGRPIPTWTVPLEDIRRFADKLWRHGNEERFRPPRR